MIGPGVWLASSDNDNSVVAQPADSDGGKSAQNDEEWIELIRMAEKVGSGGIAALALPAVPSKSVAEEYLRAFC